MNVARRPEEPEPGRRAVALGTFDGVHLGHRAVVEAARATGLPVAAVTWEPGRGDALVCSLERRLELLAALGVEETLVLAGGRDRGATQPAASLRALGAELVAVGTGADAGVASAPGVETVVVPAVEGVSAARIRELVTAGEVEAAAPLLGRPVEVEGTVVAGDARGAGLGFPTANLDPPRGVVVPRLGIYAGTALGVRAAVSVGTNPTYGGGGLRIEAFLLDWEGDLYGRRLVVELWRRLRDERAFGSERELVEQIARDVEATRAALPPV